jgi:hypothetical protein
MANRDILAIGTSAGGFNALRVLASGFSPDFPETVLIVIHLPAGIESNLDALLTQAGPLPASFARHGEAMERGRVYIAPPACHLLVDGDRLGLGHGPRENYARPAIDLLFSLGRGMLRSSHHRRGADRHHERRRGRPAGAQGGRRADGGAGPQRRGVCRNAGGGPAPGQARSRRGPSRHARAPGAAGETARPSRRRSGSSARWTSHAMDIRA